MIWLAVIDNSKLMHPANGSEEERGLISWTTWRLGLQASLAAHKNIFHSQYWKKNYNTRPVLKKIYLVALNVADTIYRFNIIVKNAHVD